MSTQTLTTPTTKTTDDQWSGSMPIKVDFQGWRSFFAKDMTLILYYKLDKSGKKVLKASLKLIEEGYGVTSTTFLDTPLIHPVGPYVVFDFYLVINSGFGKGESKGVEMPLGGRTQSAHVHGAVNVLTQNEGVFISSMGD